MQKYVHFSSFETRKLYSCLILQSRKSVSEHFLGCKTWKVNTFKAMKCCKLKSGIFGLGFAEIFVKISKSETQKVFTFWFLKPGEFLLSRFCNSESGLRSKKWIFKTRSYKTMKHNIYTKLN